MRYGFVNVAAAVPMVKVADVAYNVEQIKSLITQADSQNVEVIVFPELCITGYTCQDLFKEQLLLDQAEQGIVQLLDFSRKLGIVSIVGFTPFTPSNFILSATSLSISSYIVVA